MFTVQLSDYEQNPVEGGYEPPSTTTEEVVVAHIGKRPPIKQIKKRPKRSIR
jgi:hypothetical protein